MRQQVAAAALGAMLVSALVACDGTDTEPAPDPTTTVQSPPESKVAPHETGVGSPIGAGLAVPDGAAQLGPLVRRRSPELVAAYEKVLKRYERRKAREEAKQNDGEQSPATTPTPDPFPTQDTFDDLDNPPEPDITTALLRVDDDPGTVFQEMLGQVAEVLPGLGVDPRRWSQFCHAKRGLYTGCELSVAGRTVDGLRVRLTITLDPGNIKKMTAPAGTQTRPAMTVTIRSTAPIDTSDALESDNSPRTPMTKPPGPASPSPIAQSTPVHAKWPVMDTSRSGGAGARLITDRWTVRNYTTLLLSGGHPAFALLVADQRADADAVARSYVLAYSANGEPARNVVEDRTEISVTYTAKTGSNRPKITATYIQAGRGDYIALFYGRPGR